MAKPSPTKKPSEATANSPTSDGEAEQPRTGLMNFALRNQGVWTLRRGCCLSEANFSLFSSTLPDFSKIRAALIFCFFLIKQKEKVFASRQKKRVAINIKNIFNIKITHKYRFLYFYKP
ncbi:MAG: hypothetical protein H6Q12_498 [Bacteroidetes bacterium]|nr:hypothetical protein [Bacteroidota bacterium]